MTETLNTYIVPKSSLPNDFTLNDLKQSIKNYLQDGVPACSECGSTNLDLDDPSYVICNDCHLCTDYYNYK